MNHNYLNLMHFCFDAEDRHPIVQGLKGSELLTLFLLYHRGYAHDLY